MKPARPRPGRCKFRNSDRPGCCELRPPEDLGERLTLSVVGAAAVMPMVPLFMGCAALGVRAGARVDDETARVLAVREGGTVGVRLAVWCLCWAGCAVV